MRCAERAGRLRITLICLRKLGAEALKIGQAFVLGMSRNEGDRTAVQEVIALTKVFSRMPVAANLDDPQPVTTFAEMDCEYAQGDGIASPMPAEELFAWYGSRRAACVFRLSFQDLRNFCQDSFRVQRKQQKHAAVPNPLTAIPVCFHGIFAPG